MQYAIGKLPGAGQLSQQRVVAGTPFFGSERKFGRGDAIERVAFAYRQNRVAGSAQSLGDTRADAGRVNKDKPTVSDDWRRFQCKLTPDWPVKPVLHACGLRDKRVLIALGIECFARSDPVALMLECIGRERNASARFALMERRPIDRHARSPQPPEDAE